ncbi:Glutathione S-transferase theta-1 [Ancistrocladus abbreviatus]
MQLQLLTEEEHNRIAGPFKKVKQWIKDVRTTTMPYFDDVHGDLFKLAAMVNKQQANNSVSGS